MDLHPDPTSWRIPPLGQAAEADLPGWLVERIADRRIQINGFGGFTVDDDRGRRWCPGGDTVVLDQDGTISFVSATQT